MYRRTSTVILDEMGFSHKDGPMKTSDTVTTSETSLIQDMLYALRYWLRGPIAMTGLVVVAVAALNWSWLAATGIAPILLAVLPCAAMCALGFCMNKVGGKSCSTQQDTPSDTTSSQTLRSRTRPSGAGAARTSSSLGDSEPPAERASASFEAEAIDQPRTSEERKTHA